MRALSICMGLALSLGWFVSHSNANITIPKMNSASQTFSFGMEGGLSASGAKSVTFTSADFGNHPTAEIISIEVAISFTKLVGNYNGALFPFYNEISMSFGKTEVGNTTFIAPGNALAPLGANSFGSGFAGNPGSGFDGVVTFSSLATARVNENQNVIPNTPGTSYRPASSAAASVPWNTFVGQSAIGTFTLNLADVDAAGDASLDPLVFRSMTVTINAVPEPSSFAAFGLLAVGGTFIRRRRGARA